MCFFFFKQKTAYEIKECDWSSDVCSSDLSLPLTMIGRHFFIDNVWFVVARNEEESKLIKTFDNFIDDNYGKPAVYFSDSSGRGRALELQKAYSTGDNEDKRRMFLKFKL